MTIEIERDVAQDLSRAGTLEWLETNGLGAWAASTVAGVNRRRDHALLRLEVQPEGAWLLCSKVDESLILGGRRIELGCNQFPGVVAPRGFEHLAAFRRELFPVWEYETAGVRLRKTVASVEGESTTLLVYEALAAPAPLQLELRPFLALRPPHALCRAGEGAAPRPSFGDGTLALRYPAGEEIFIAVPDGFPLLAPDWWYRFELESERQRGIDYEEDLWTPGVFRCALAAGARLGVIVSAHQPSARDAFELLEGERRRREKALARIEVQDEITRTLGVAADQFLVRRPAGGRAIVAGYPAGTERTDSTAEALIALPGLLLSTGRAGEARRVLRGVVRAARDGGVLPDQLAGGFTATAQDTSLWLFPAAYRFLLASGDEAFTREALLPLLRRIVAAHEQGTPADLGVAADGLLSAPADSPRPGKAAEINALWHNALATLAALEARCGDAAAGTALAQRARRLAKRFGEVFFRAEAGALYDLVDGERRDPALRAHHVLAIGLPFSALSKTRALRLLETIEERLHTPNGLRDRAAGEGVTVVAWPWLLGPFLSALVRFRGPLGRRQALELLVGLDPQLAEGCIGTLPEAVTADPPHWPRGRVSQATSVGEVLRAYVEDLAPPPAPAKPARPRKRSASTPAGTSRAPRAARTAAR
jgi:predicted glycogen debranching enzyme